MRRSEILAYCCMNNANRSQKSLRSTFSNCHTLFQYLHSFVHTSLHSAMCVINRRPYNQNSQLGRDCDQPTSTTTDIVDDTAYYSASTPSWTQTTVAWRMDTKFSALRHLSRKLLHRSYNAIFTSPTCTPPGVIPANFGRRWVQKPPKLKNSVKNHKSIQIKCKFI